MYQRVTNCINIRRENKHKKIYIAAITLLEKGSFQKIILVEVNLSFVTSFRVKSEPRTRHSQDEWFVP